MVFLLVMPAQAPRAAGAVWSSLRRVGGGKIRPGSGPILRTRRDQVKRWRAVVANTLQTFAGSFPAGPRACSSQMFVIEAGGGVWPTERMTALDYCSCVTVTL